MALILKAAGVTFTNFITSVSPAENPGGWFDFGIDEASSLKDKTNNQDLTSFGITAAISYTATSVVFPQASAGENFFRYSNKDLRQFSVAAYVEDGSVFERVFTSVEGGGLSTSNAGVLSFSVELEDGTAPSVSFLQASYPAAVVGTISEDSGNSTVELTLTARYSDGSTNTASETFAGLVSLANETTTLDIGRNSSGEYVASETLFYTRALNASEINQTLNYLQVKYS